MSPQIQHLPKAHALPGPARLVFWQCSCGLSFSTPLGMLTHMAYPAQEFPPMRREYTEVPMVGPLEVVGSEQ